jgi:pimeloyl-ACP methyl ester carboxylesterase
MRLVGSSLLGALVAAYAGVSLLAFVFQERLIFPAPPPRPLPTLAAAEVWWLAAREGTAPALYLEGPPGAPVIVHFHGNAEQLADLGDLFRRLREQGLGVLGVEYPGYGAAAGSPSERAMDEVAELALQRLRARGVAPARIVLQGQSLGTGVAAEMALRGHGGKLSLLSPYTSMVDMARRVAPWLPVSALLVHRFDTAAKAPKLDIPVLIVHGTRDEVVPVAMGARLAQLFPRARLQLVEGASHAGLFAARAEDMAALIAGFAREP